MDPQPEPVSLSTDPLSSQLASLNDLAHELASLEDLANRGSWRSILDRVARARSLSLLNTPHDHLTYLAYNVLAFSKLRRFKDALTELDSLDDFDSHHYFYETYPKIYPNRSGSMVPFSLRWLHALIPIKLGDRQLGLDRFYLLLDFVREKIRVKKESDVAIKIWSKREVFVMNQIVTEHLKSKEYSVCLDLINDLVSRNVDPVLLSKLGHVQMQIGDLEGAKLSFDQVEKLFDPKKDDHDDLLLSEIEFRNLISRNKALVYLVGKDYISAVREYEECIERDAMDAVAINNKALCLMYLRDLSDSIKVLECSLERVPTVALNETLVVNLCSMYELAYVNHSDIKRTLSNWISRVAPDDFDSSCTRI